MQIITLEERSAFPKVVRQNFSRELYSMGSLEAHIKSAGGTILSLWGNFANWKVVVKYK